MQKAKVKNMILDTVSKAAFVLFFAAICSINSKTFTMSTPWFVAFICSGVWLATYWYANCFWKGAKK